MMCSTINVLREKMFCMIVKIIAEKKMIKIKLKVKKSRIQFRGESESGRALLYTEVGRNFHILLFFIQYLIKTLPFYEWRSVNVV